MQLRFIVQESGIQILLTGDGQEHTDTVRVLKPTSRAAHRNVLDRTFALIYKHANDGTWSYRELSESARVALGDLLVRRRKISHER